MVAWTTEYDVLAVKSMRAACRCVDDEVLAHVFPAHSENITSSASLTWTSTLYSRSLVPTVTGPFASARPSSASCSTRSNARPKDPQLDGATVGLVGLLGGDPAQVFIEDA